MTMATTVREAIAAARWDQTLPGDPQDAAENLAILRQLYAIGRRDLPIGRLVEGHVDAVQIVHRYGTDAQIERLRRLAAQGAMLGVWNAGLAGEPLSLADGLLRGGKSYASGAGVLTHALVTAEHQGRQQLILIDLFAVAPTIDRSWWRTTGMQRSETHQVRWAGAVISDDALIGGPDSYAREPFFSGGALRFVAVHAGGIAGLCDHTRDHLVATGRADDPFQRARLAELFWLAESAAATVRHAAVAWFETEQDEQLARVAAARLAVAELAERALGVSQQAVGLAGHFLDHPLSAMLADLAVYLRQPAPDAQRLRVGHAVQERILVPAL